MINFYWYLITIHIELIQTTSISVKLYKYCRYLLVNVSWGGLASSSVILIENLWLAKVDGKNDILGDIFFPLNPMCELADCQQYYLAIIAKWFWMGNQTYSHYHHYSHHRHLFVTIDTLLKFYQQNNFCLDSYAPHCL